MSRCGPDQAIFTQYRHLNLIQNVIGQHLRFSGINDILFVKSRQTIPKLDQFTAGILLLFFAIFIGGVDYFEHLFGEVFLDFLQSCILLEVIIDPALQLLETGLIQPDFLMQPLAIFLQLFILGPSLNLGDQKS